MRSLRLSGLSRFPHAGFAFPHEFGSDQRSPSSIEKINVKNDSSCASVFRKTSPTKQFHQGGLTVSVDFFVAAPRLAVIVTCIESDTEIVPISNVALLAPEGTVTFEGTPATEESLLLSDT
jgi:hypothetical protein